MTGTDGDYCGFGRLPIAGHSAQWRWPDLTDEAILKRVRMTGRHYCEPTLIPTIIYWLSDDGYSADQYSAPVRTSDPAANLLALLVLTGGTTHC